MAVPLKRRAVRDLRAARDWYNERATGVGTRFVLEFEAVIGEIESAPLAFQIIEGEVRRALLRRFPFSVYYVVEGTEVTVLAVLHFRQHPEA